MLRDHNMLSIVDVLAVFNIRYVWCTYLGFNWEISKHMIMYVFFFLRQQVLWTILLIFYKNDDLRLSVKSDFTVQISSNNKDIFHLIFTF